MLTDTVFDNGKAGVADRDALAYTMLSLGYSVRETTDVVSQRISRKALDTAHAMRLTGRTREAAAYLEQHYRRIPVPNVFAHVTAVMPMSRPANTVAVRIPAAPTPASQFTKTPSVAPVRPATAPRSSSPIEDAITKYARLHAVDLALVRAIVGTESGFAANARSAAGAIGLMQLMPATARALGVNPHNTDENIEGGVRYLAELIRMFGGVELALVAYNAGPGFAERYARGQATLYGETREYVKQVMARISAMR